MNVNDDKLTKEELQYLIERLSLPEDESTDNADTLSQWFVRTNALRRKHHRNRRQHVYLRYTN
jgi:hypothetical protein